MNDLARALNLHHRERTEGTPDIRRIETSSHRATSHPFAAEDHFISSPQESRGGIL
jgi:hypothetical protein